MSALSLRIAQLQVLSRALAHLAHDVQNHLAIINESAGWMKDLMKFKNKQRFGRIGSFFKSDKQRAGLEPYLNDLNTIETHVNQASIITQRLSSFAHGLEKNRSVFNTGKALEEIQDVLMKQTGDMGIRLELKLTGESLMIETDPSGFQLAVFENVEHIIKTLESGDCLILETTLKDGQFQVSLTGPCHGGYRRSLIEKPDEKDFYWYIIENLGGQIKRQFVDEQCVTTLSFALTGDET
jgi:two-component system NtrC family sensor kinase